MEMACRPARRREAVLAASHMRSRDVVSTMLVSTMPCPHRHHAIQAHLHAVKHACEQPVLSIQSR